MTAILDPEKGLIDEQGNKVKVKIKHLFDANVYEVFGATDKAAMNAGADTPTRDKIMCLLKGEEEYQEFRVQSHACVFEMAGKIFDVS